ncbi:SWIM zinc finger family protein [candidate division KSB1 bacterium]
MARIYRFYDYAYRPAHPKEVKGGIKAQSKSGQFAKKWWGRRWIQTLESFNIGARLSRGRSYARKGQVADLYITKDGVSAKVQGTRSKPYLISIKLKPFSAKQWDLLIAKLIDQPVFAAQLLGNEMPEDIETIFKDTGLSLFPQKQRDIETDCSCPDWSNPCKHIAAVFYLMAEAFENDPFLLFKLRGMDRDEILGKLSERSVGKNIPEDAGPIREFLPLENTSFWGDYRKYDPPANVQPVRLHASLPKRLGHLPFWRAEENFINVMEDIYRRASSNIENLQQSL